MPLPSRVAFVTICVVTAACSMPLAKTRRNTDLQFVYRAEQPLFDPHVRPLGGYPLERVQVSESPDLHRFTTSIRGSSIETTLGVPIRRIVLTYYEKEHYSQDQIEAFVATLLRDRAEAIDTLVSWSEAVVGVVVLGRIELADGTSVPFEAAIGHAYFRGANRVWWTRHVTFEHP